MKFLLSLLGASMFIAPETNLLQPCNNKSIWDNNSNNYLFDNFIRVKRYNKQFQDVIDNINDFSLEVNNLATAIDGQKFYFNLLQKNLNANEFVNYLRSLSEEIRTLTTSNYNIQALTSKLKHKIRKLGYVIYEMGDVSLLKFPGFNGGSALISISNNINKLSLIIEKLGEKLQEAENKLQGSNENQIELNRLKNDLETSSSTIKNLNLKITELQNNLKAANDKIKDTNQDNFNLQNALKIEKNETNKFVAELAGCRSKETDLNNELSEANNKVFDFQHNKLKVEQQKENLEMKLNEQNIQMLNLQQELNQINLSKNALIEEKEEQLNETSIKIKNLKIKWNDSNADMKDLQNERNILINEIKNINATTLKNKIKGLREDNEKHKETIKDIQNQNMTGMPGSVVMLLKEKVKELTLLMETNNNLIKENETKLNSDIKGKDNRITEIERELNKIKLEKNEIEKQLDKLNKDGEELKIIAIQFKSLDADTFFRKVMKIYANKINDLNSEIITLLETICPM